MTRENKTGKSNLGIALPCQYNRGRMLGVLDHEVGTHFLRSYNEKYQIWYNKREQCNMKTSIATEEGFAICNQLVRTVSRLSYFDFVDIGMG